MIFNNKSGQSIFEVIIAMAVFALMVAGIASLVLGGFLGLEQGGQQTQGQELAQEGIEAIKSIQDRAWNEICFQQSGLGLQSNLWVLLGEGTSEQIGRFTRLITFEDVCRDQNGNIAVCPADFLDVNAKKVNVNVSWEVRQGVNNFVNQIAYLTNWDAIFWKEDLMLEFSDGVFTNTITSPLGDGDGAVTLSPL